MVRDFLVINGVLRIHKKTEMLHILKHSYILTKLKKLAVITFRPENHKTCIIKLHLHVAVYQTGSSKGEGKAEPKTSQPVVWRCDRVVLGRSEEPPSDKEKKII